MLTLAIGWAGILLELSILVRGLACKISPKYPYFFVFIACALVGNVLMYVSYVASPASYAGWYWATQFLTMFLACGIILEILKHVLDPYPGAEKFAGIGGLVVFGMVVCFAIVYRLLVPEWSLTATNIELERDLRTIQAILLCTVLGVISYYRITLGKNMKGMILGYGLYIGTSLMSLAMRSYAGPTSHHIWAAVQPFSYDGSLMIWTVSLWSYHPNPAPGPAVGLEEDYGALALKTRALINTMRAHLFKAVRS